MKWVVMDKSVEGEGERDGEKEREREREGEGEREREGEGEREREEKKKWRHHKHEIGEHQCSSSLVKRIRAPLPLVWSLVRRFDEPQKYKPFVQRCNLVMSGEVTDANKVGCEREVTVISGLPATKSLERLEILDDSEHVFSYRILGGDHRLKNYCSVVSLHPEMIDGKPGTLVIESYVVDIPQGNTREDTKFFVEALIKCNFKSLADIVERLASQVQSPCLTSNSKLLV